MIGVCVWCADVARHEANLRQFADSGLSSDHPLVVRSRRRMLWAQRFDERRHPDSSGTVR